ncbi:imelysin family protein [Aureimonas sp. SK2]|uniref:imelysin family protein n=1 Tax=Aureimonas sp. SK2 TaxID=3015992 RepID=UPI002444DDF1|nr:imelysin family protein [Aureimonas sp. SK2]
MRRFAFLAIAFILPILPAGAQEAPSRAAVVAATIDRVIRPGYAALAEAARDAHGRAEAACAAPSPEALAQLREGFAALVAAHARIEPIRFGPVAEDNRIERWLLWPDRRGIALRQVQDALGRQDATVLDPAALGRKSVALQGLTALEYLLYGDGAQALETGAGDFRCRFALSILTRMAEMGASLSAEWAEGAPIVRRMTHPSPDDARYRSDTEALEEIFAAAAHGLELVRDVRLRPGLGKPGEEPKPQLFLFRRSGLTGAALSANVDGLSTLLSEGGLFTLLPPASQWAGPSIGLEFETAGRILASLDRPVPDLVETPEGRSRLESVAIAVRGVETVLSGEVAPALGLSAGFSSLDGD